MSTIKTPNPCLPLAYLKMLQCNDYCNKDSRGGPLDYDPEAVDYLIFLKEQREAARQLQSAIARDYKGIILERQLAYHREYNARLKKRAEVNQNFKELWG